MSKQKKFRTLYNMPGHLIRRCHQISVGSFHERCGGHDLTPIQFALLWGIDTHPQVDQIQLSRIIGVDRTTIGNVILRLEARGLIQRQQDRQDRRVKRLTLTAAGESFLARVMPDVRQVQNHLLAPLDREERRTFIRLLGKIVEQNNDSSRVPADQP